MPTGSVPPASRCAPPAGYPTSNQTSGVECPRILRCTRCRKTRTRACSRSVASAMPEAACSTLARRPSLISPQVSRWRRRPPDHAMTVSTRPGASPATIAPRSARAPGAGSRSRPAAARRPPRRAREAGARRPAPPPLEGAPVCSPPGSGRARSCPTTARHPGSSTLTTISARPGPARRNPAARLRRPGEEVQGDEAVHDVCAGSRKPECRVDVIRNGNVLRLLVGGRRRHTGVTDDLPCPNCMASGPGPGSTSARGAGHAPAPPPSSTYVWSGCPNTMARS